MPQPAPKGSAPVRTSPSRAPGTPPPARPAAPAPARPQQQQQPGDQGDQWEDNDQGGQQQQQPGGEEMTAAQLSSLGKLIATQSLKWHAEAVCKLLNLERADVGQILHEVAADFGHA